MGRKKVQVAWPALKAAFVGLYDHLGIAMVFSLLWLLIGVAPHLFVYPIFLEARILGGILALLVAALVTFPATCAVWEACRRLKTREGAGGGDFFRFFGQYFKPAFLLGLTDGALCFVLLVDLYVAFTSGNKFFLFLGGFWIWFGVFWLLMQPYLIPLLLAGNGVGGNLKKSALLVLDNLGNSFLILLESVLLLLLCLLIPPLLVLFFPVLVGFFHTEAFEIIFSKYDEEDGDAEVAGT